jgi:hypothetical protein
MSASAQAEIFNASNAPDVYEKGGKYGQHGVDFQRYWAISRVIELVGGDAPDFLILFETIQDVLELDSGEAPTRARIHQLKMKNTGERTWKSLTGLPAKARKKRGSTEMTEPEPFNKTPIGKLASALAELDQIQAEGIFVSNGGCDAELEAGATAGTVSFCSFSALSKQRRDEIAPELAVLKKPISLDALHFHRTALSLDDLDTHVVGKICKFLETAAPKHTGQSRPFADSIFATVSARGRKTSPAPDFAGLVAHCGYSKADFMDAVETLRNIPDRQAIVASWLVRLNTEGMHIRDLTRMEIKLAQFFERRLGNGQPGRTPLHEAVAVWVAAHPVGDSILKFMTAGTTAIENQMPGAAQEEIHAALLLEGVSQCLDQI